MGQPDRIVTGFRKRRDLDVAFSGVILHLAPGVRRTIEHADSAHVDGPFLIVTRRYQGLNRRETVLTLRADDVVAADIVKEAATISRVPVRKARP